MSAVVRQPQHSRYRPIVENSGGARLRDVEISGSRMKTELSKACISASISSSMSSVTELKFTFLDEDDLKLYRSGVFREGQTVSYAHWRGRILGGGKVKAVKGGPQIEVTAPSLFVSRLKEQTGSRTWENVNLSSWFRARCNSVGIRMNVQDHLGVKTITRAKPEGDNPQSTWDVMTEVARENGLWLFEHSARLIVGKPSWVMNRDREARRVIPVRWTSWNNYSDGLMGLPDFTPGPRAEQKLRVRVTGSDDHLTCPGDTVEMSGNLNGGTTELNANGVWVVEGVNLPLSRADAVTLDCIRPVFDAFGGAS